MAQLQLKQVNKFYDKNVQAVNNFNLDIEDEDFIVLVGPSGCGKSTTLRMIAGLEDISNGELIIDGRRMNEVAPKDRDIAMVFQNYALYPHMSVFDNMAFGLKLKKVPKSEIKRRVTEAATILGLEPYLNRKPKALSGGQRQRVALGRAIVRDANIFLMDEPLSNLDAKLRGQMRAEIIKLHRKLNTTTIYVTHDQTEAMTMATKMVVMKDGIVQQIGAPKEIYDFPINKFVGTFIGSPAMNFLHGILRSNCVEVGGARMNVPFQMMDTLKSAGYVGRSILLGIRPEHIYEGNGVPPLDAEATLKTTVDVAESMGSETYVYANIEHDRLIAKLDSNQTYMPGAPIELTLDMENCHFFDAETEQRIHMKNATQKASVI